MKKQHHAGRGGLGSQIKRGLKKTVREAVVRRWFFIAVFKTAVWLIKRLWLDKNHTDPSP